MISQGSPKKSKIDVPKHSTDALGAVIFLLFTSLGLLNGLSEEQFISFYLGIKSALVNGDWVMVGQGVINGLVFVAYKRWV